MISALRTSVALTGRAMNFFSSEIRGLHNAAYILALAAIGSSLLALARDRLLAHVFGAGFELDLYYAAFRVPDILFVALGALVSAYVLIPELQRRVGDEERRSYLDATVLWFSVFSIGASIVAAFVAPYFLKLLFPKIVAAGHLTLLVHLTRIILLQPIILGFSNICAGVTQFRHRYALYALSPIVYNLGIIIGVIFLFPVMGLVGLAWGVVLGALLHACIQVPSIVKDGYFRLRLPIDSLRTVLNSARISVPRSLALSMGQLAFLGLLALAGTLAPGSISIFMFAFNLQAVPLSIIGASYSVAAFPRLAALSEAKPEEFIEHVCVAARHVLFWSMPALALLVVLRAHVVRVILGSGAFDWSDTRLTAAALALFGVSLAAQGLTLLLVRGYYASGRTAIPFSVAAATSVLTVILGVIFLNVFHYANARVFIGSLLRVDNTFGLDVLALPLAYSLAAITGALILATDFNIRFKGHFFRAMSDAFLESLSAGFAAALTAYLTLILLGTVTVSSTLGSVLIRGSVAGIVGLIAAMLSYYALGSREFEETRRALEKRMWREVEPVSSAE